MNIVSKILLLPFTALYSLAILLRNYGYNNGILKSVKFDLPVISIGNLTTGGTGKTPHTEYLIELLKNDYNIGVLSRGYKRRSSGFIEVQTTSTAELVGDEPLMYKWKHPDIKVAVCEERALGIPALVMTSDEPMTILLDDAFQHRAVKPGISILLTEFDNLFTDDALLPTGRLREFKSAYERADLIIVTKSPENLTEENRNDILEKIKPKSYQYVFFSYIENLPSYSLFQHSQSYTQPAWNTTALLIAGIANPSLLQSKIEKEYKQVYTRFFNDHHLFSREDIESIITTFETLPDENKAIVTTEKDATRLAPFEKLLKDKGIAVFCSPIKINFAPQDKMKFEKAIRLYIDTILGKDYERNIETNTGNH